MNHTTLHKAGFVPIIGQPNVGKSTLMNALIGEKISIVTPKVQTTRQQICGIAHADDYQIVFVDTPGILTPAYMLQQKMLHNIKAALIGADLVLWLVDSTEESVPPLIDQLQVEAAHVPLLLVINKIDLLDETALHTRCHYWKGKIPALANIIAISALKGFNKEDFLTQIVSYLPTHPPYYPKDILSDKNERFFASEFIREQIFKHYQQEIPYATEVSIESFKAIENIIHIVAIIYVERKSQKAILIGKRGEALKKVGTMARQSLEYFLNKKVFLQQYVKVLPDWRYRDKTLKRLGYEEM